MRNRLVRYLVKAVVAEMHDEEKESPSVTTAKFLEEFVESRYPKGPADVYVEWRLWEEIPDEAEAGPAVGWYKRTRQPSSPHTGQEFAGLVGRGEEVPVARVVFTYQHYGSEKAYVAELGASDGTYNYRAFPGTVRPALLKAGWKKLPANARRVKASERVVYAQLLS